MREKPKVITSVRKPTAYERDQQEQVRKAQTKVLFLLYGITAAFLAYIWSKI